MARELGRWFEKLVQAQPGVIGKSVVLLVSVALTLALATLRLALEIHLAVSLAPLLPVVLIVSWYLGMAFGVGMAIFVVCAWLVPDLVGSTPDLPHVVAIINAAVRACVLGLVAVLVAALHAAYRRQQELATNDGLTGLSNRRHFMSVADAERQRGMRLGHPVTIAFFDLDGFKGVNDRFGHAEGDEVLRLVGRFLRRRMRRIDCAARLGGDEFALLLPETGEEDGLQAVTDIWQGAVAALADRRYPVGISAGLVTFTQMPSSVDDMVHAADAMMYSAKRKGGSRLEHAASTLPPASGVALGSDSPPEQREPRATVEKRPI